MKILEILTPKRLLGNVGERAAAKYLKRHGYKILERNYVAIGYEIDLIAKKRDTLHFVEVKSRTDIDGTRFEPRPSSSVTPEKQKKIITAAKFYMGSRGLKNRVSLDVIEVYLYKDTKKTKLKEVKHLENAFNLNTARVKYMG